MSQCKLHNFIQIQLQAQHTAKYCLSAQFLGAERGPKKRIYSRHKDIMLSFCNAKKCDYNSQEKTA